MAESNFPKHPPDGWHWLRRRRDGAYRAAFYDRLGAGWRVSDLVGRTVLMSGTRAARLYAYDRPIPAPEPEPVADKAVGTLSTVIAAELHRAGLDAQEPAQLVSALRLLAEDIESDRLSAEVDRRPGRGNCRT